MGSVFEKFQRERDEKMFKLGVKLTIKAAKMLKDGMSPEIVSEEIGLTVERIEEIQ